VLKVVFNFNVESEIHWPPPPHDPRERELAMVVDGWEVRLFGERKFQYFVTRGLWHVQLWHPIARVSVLTPSRLTCGLYEAYPIANWKAQAPDYARLVALLAGAAVLPSAGTLARVEKAFVDDVVRGQDRLVS
jgi:hypothetical protein